MDLTKPVLVTALTFGTLSPLFRQEAPILSLPDDDRTALSGAYGGGAAIYSIGSNTGTATPISGLDLLGD